VLTEAVDKMDFSQSWLVQNSRYI